MNGFANKRPNGFHMTFQNGWTISVQWSHHNYCSRQDYSGIMDDTPAKSIDAEIAIWDRNGKWYDFTSGQADGEYSDHVKGWVTPDEVVEWMYKVSKWSSQ